MHIPYTQTTSWAALNKHSNQLDPVTIEEAGISCLFGFDPTHATLTSFGGPVVPQNALKDDLSQFLKRVLGHSTSATVAEINFRALNPLRSWGPELESAFKESGFKHQEWKTILVDLNQPEDDLLKNFEHSARKGIKKASSLGVKIELCDSFDLYFSRFLKPYFATTNRDLKDKKFYQTSWDLDTEKTYRYWVAKTQNDELLGFLGTYRHSNVATEIMSALTPLAFELKIPVQDLIHWEIMKHHKGLGDHYFDLAGFNPNPTNDKEKNIRRFKEKWGGAVYDVSSYTLDTRTFVSKVLSKIKRTLNV